MKALALVAFIVAGCSAAAGTPRIVYVTPPPASAAPVQTTAPLDPNLGKVSFGTHFDASTLEIDRGSMTFGRTAAQVCWSADLSESPSHASIREVVVRQSSGGVETGVISRTQEVTNPKYTVWANCEPFPAELAHKAGSYVLRFLDGVNVLAQGRFILK